MRSKFEVRAHKELEENGYLVDYKIRPSGYKNPSNYSVDYFNVFDLLAYKPGELRWISVKPASNCPRKHQEMVDKIDLPGTKEIWRYDRDPKNKRTIRRRIWVFKDGERIDGED
jgi:hypothetical protein